ncbi:hypothetical protein EC9_51810 [Rosistilla ulvae]|uniref:Uncharacterized protein n=1 Tax=Rosistilla ulvae TaxID=1930277 RepID=A0A517M7V2_9BACT|nr:hypothetical protein EC9_51810 [Rosistilla ulvae]
MVVGIPVVFATLKPPATSWGRSAVHGLLGRWCGPWNARAVASDATIPKGCKKVAGGRRAAAHLRNAASETRGDPGGIADRGATPLWAVILMASVFRWCSLLSNHRLPSGAAPRSICRRYVVDFRWCSLRSNHRLPSMIPAGIGSPAWVWRFAGALNRLAQRGLADEAALGFDDADPLFRRECHVAIAAGFRGFKSREAVVFHDHATARG